MSIIYCSKLLNINFQKAYPMCPSFLLLYNMIAHVCRVIVARLMSAAGTGYFYTLRKPRLRERMTLRKYDPIGE